MSSDSDRAYISGLAEERGGYDRLDGAIKNLRVKMAKELEYLLDPKTHKEEQPGNHLGYGESSEETILGDWLEKEKTYEDAYDGEEDYEYSLSWRFAGIWREVMQEMHRRYATGIEAPALPEVKWENGGRRDREPTDKEAITRDVLDILQHSVSW